MARILITGGTGWLGAATTRQLLDRGADDVVVAARSGSPGALPLWLDPAAERRVRIAACDFASPHSVASLLARERPQRVIHLAAARAPDRDRDPHYGLAVDVGGTLALLEACAAEGTVERLVFASCAAVHGSPRPGSGAPVRESDRLEPLDLYGIWKVAGEHLVRVFHARTGVPALCLRLHTPYGKGREKGRAAAATAAIRAVAHGAQRRRAVPFRMPCTGPAYYQLVDDAGAGFAAAALDAFDGFGAFHVRGHRADAETFLDLVARAARERGLDAWVDLGIAPDAAPLRTVADLDDGAMARAFPAVPVTPLDEGIGRTLDACLAEAQR